MTHQLRRPWRDGTTHFIFDPLTFIERLAALVPRPRRPLLTYHGVLAPAASWRDSIVPAPPSTCLHSEGEAQPERWRTWA
ncbi:MAG: IS91 family transposase, partial [Planctomycetes bacterium]|nr:IS91 family transposase [Planctomycetota bacterium]